MAPQASATSGSSTAPKDLYQRLSHTGPGKFLTGRLGLPQPPTLRRYRHGRPELTEPVALGAAQHARLEPTVREVLTRLRADIHPADQAPQQETRYGAMIFDASGITDIAQLDELHTFFHPRIRSVADSGRVIVLGTPPEACETPRQAIAQRALEGFTRAVGKEVRHGATSQLVYVSPGAESACESTLRFLLSPRSAYVSGQVVRVGDGPLQPPEDWSTPLQNRVALVTGAARGIGASIAQVLATQGAEVICLDVPAQGAALSRVANTIGGTALQADITSESAPAEIIEHISQRHGTLDILVNNAGITRDKTLGKMSAEAWSSVLSVNVDAGQRLIEALTDAGVLRHDSEHGGGRVIGVSSISGIAGNAGQTNYSTSKAAVIGLVQAMAPRLAEQNITVNAVAPGFIETAMTATMPVGLREAGRRMNSMNQGGLPTDVAETIAWLAHPASGGVTGNLVRVCGQSLLGA